MSLNAQPVNLAPPGTPHRVHLPIYYPGPYAFTDVRGVTYEGRGFLARDGDDGLADVTLDVRNVVTATWPAD